MGPLMVPNDEPKSVNIDKISTALHVYYLNLIVNYLNTVQIAQIQAYNFECTRSHAITGQMNRVFDIKSGHDFCRYRNSIQVIYFQINGEGLSKYIADSAQSVTSLVGIEHETELTSSVIIKLKLNEIELKIISCFVAIATLSSPGLLNETPIT